MRKILSIILITVMLLSVLLPTGAYASSREMRFRDVKKGAWYYGAVEYCFNRGLLRGTNVEGTVFSPGRVMTRIEFVTTLFRLSGADEKEYERESDFPDIPFDSWMNAPALWAREKGYVIGNDKGEFMPHTPLDRQTLATLMYRYAADVYEAMPVRESAFERFYDKAEVADWARDAVKWAVTVSLINGTGERREGAPMLAPRICASRAQAAQILMNYDNLWYGREYPIGDILIGDISISEYTVVYSQGYEALAAELVKYLKMATGTELEYACDSECGIGENEILIGRTNREGVTVDIDRSRCKGDIQAFVYGVCNGNLYITSNEEGYGTEYGVYDLLEVYAGINFFGAIETVDVKKCFCIPSELDYFETTPIQDYLAFMSYKYGCESKWKCQEINNTKGFYHSIPALARDPEEFEPTYRYLTDYHMDPTPCLSDKKIKENIITNVRRIAGGNGVWVGIGDKDTFCRCGECKEHGISGAVLKLLNEIAYALEDEFPDTMIIGLGYSFAWDLIQGIDAGEIHRNVAIVVCTDNMCGTHSITSDYCENSSNPNIHYEEQNPGEWLKEVDGYRECYDKIVELYPNIWIWDYIYPSKHNEAPLPLFHRMYDNYKYFLDSGVSGFNLQNNGDENACFDALRAYMAAKLLRDGKDMSEKEYWALIDEFLKEYYGDGWSFIREYIDYTFELSQENEWHIWSNEDWNDIITEEQYRENFDYLMGLWERAESLAQTEEMAERVRRDSTQMKYIELCLVYEDYADSAKTEADLDIYEAARDAYVEILERYGFEMPNIGNLNPADWKYE